MLMSRVGVWFEKQINISSDFLFFKIVMSNTGQVSVVELRTIETVANS